MSRLTKKEQILQFVESQGSATFTEIQRFIVDLNYGKGTYDAAAKDGSKHVYSAKEGKHILKPANPYRGYYCTAFSGGCFRTKAGYQSREGNLVSGPEFLVRGEDGKYIVMRKKKNLNIN